MVPSGAVCGAISVRWRCKLVQVGGMVSFFGAFFVEAGTALGMLYERIGEVDEAIKAYKRIQQES